MKATFQVLFDYMTEL